MILLFPSIHHVLTAEKRLTSCGIACSLVPTPKELSADCGMSLAISPDDVQAAIQALSGMNFEKTHMP